jgi:transcriptional regulator with XRE-family HTH domain
MSKSIHTKEYQKLLKKLKKARKDSRLTQLEISQKLEKPQSFISKCESGERRIDTIELLKFAKIYKKDINFFIK